MGEKERDMKGVREKERGWEEKRKNGEEPKKIEK